MDSNMAIILKLRTEYFTYFIFSLFPADPQKNTLKFAFHYHRCYLMFHCLAIKCKITRHE